MPGVNGLEAIPRIRALNNPPAILVLSMHDEAQMAARALKVGAAGYATKDSDPALLLTAIRKVAAGGRYMRNLSALAVDPRTGHLLALSASSNTAASPRTNTRSSRRQP